MPRGDGTGPMGFGPMTGRAAGYCAGYQTPGYVNSMPGRGMGGGRGAGRGRRNWFNATGMPDWARAGAGFPAWGGGVAAPVAPPVAPPMNLASQLEALKSQADYFQKALEGIRDRESIEGSPGTSSHRVW